MSVSKPRCKRCGSAHVYRRNLSNEIVCQMCGHVEKQKEGVNF